MLARRRVHVVLLVGACVGVGMPASTRAGREAARYDGDRFGPVLAQAATLVRVDHATLAFAVADDLASAEVSATYTLTNPGATCELEVAFAVVRGHKRPWRQPYQRPYEDEAIAVDGAAVSFRVVRDVEVYEPTLTALLESNPPLTSALRQIAPYDDRASDEMHRGVEQLVTAAGGRCDGRCGGLVGWYREAYGFAGEDRRDPWIVQEERERWLVDAAQEAIPQVVESTTRGWSTAGSQHRHGPRRTDWLRFRLDFAAGQTRSVTVRYTHRPDEDHEARVSPTYTYETLLSPAHGWAGFGPLAVSIELPERTKFASASTFTGEGDERRAMVPTLPGDDLRFELMTRRGLWFGQTDPQFYWVLLAVAMVLTNVAVSRAAARRRARFGPGLWRTLAHTLGGGLLAMSATIAVVVAFFCGVKYSMLPRYALGSGGDFSPIIEIVLLLMLSGLIGAIAGRMATSAQY